MTKKEREKLYRKQYSAERSRIVKAVRRAQEAGYFVDETIIPPKLKDLQASVKYNDVRKLSKITPQKIKANSQGYVDKTTGELLTPQEGTILRKQENATISAINSAKGRVSQEIKREEQQFGVHFSEDQIQRRIGKELYDYHASLMAQGKTKEAQTLMANLDNKDYESFVHAMGDKARQDTWREAFKQAEQELKEKKDGSQRPVSSARKKREDLLSDEGSEFPSDESSGQGRIYNEQGETEDYSSGNEISPYNEGKEVKPKEHKISKKAEEKIDKAIEQWKDDFEKQKHKPRKEREYSRDSYSIYAGIKSRMELFDKYMNDPKFETRYWNNNEARIILEKSLNGAIKKDGLNKVLKRIQDAGSEIDELMDDLLFQYGDAHLVNNNLSRLSEIFHGGSLSQQESELYSSMGDFADYASDDDLDEMEIEEDE